MLQRLRLCRTSDTVFRHEIDSRRQWGYGTCYGGSFPATKECTTYHTGTEKIYSFVDLAPREDVVDNRFGLNCEKNLRKSLESSPFLACYDLPPAANHSWPPHFSTAWWSHLVLGANWQNNSPICSPLPNHFSWCWINNE